MFSINDAKKAVARKSRAAAATKKSAEDWQKETDDAVQFCLSMLRQSGDITMIIVSLGRLAAVSKFWANQVEFSLSEKASAAFFLASPGQFAVGALDLVAQGDTDTAAAFIAEGLEKFGDDYFITRRLVRFSRTKAELQQQCTKLGLSKSGDVASLKKRLKDHVGC